MKSTGWGLSFMTFLFNGFSCNFLGLSMCFFSKKRTTISKISLNQQSSVFFFPSDNKGARESQLASFDFSRQKNGSHDHFFHFFHTLSQISRALF